MTRGTEPPSVSGPSPADVREALARILNSRCFGQAGRASDFLRFVVEQTLTGHGRNLKGYVIATAVFGRPADFDAQVDPLVRVEAGRLRRRLAEYYAGEGQREPIRIALPRGHYAPEWRYAEGPATDAGVPPARVPAADPALEARRWRRLSIALAAALVLSLAGLAWREFAMPAVSLDVAADWAPADDGTRFPLIVTPFENLSGEPELDRSAMAMTEEIILRLDRLDVRVIATQSNTSGQDLSGIANDNAGYVLTGSIRTAGDHARITVRLVEATSGELLWSAAYNEPPSASEQAAFHERMAFEIATAAAPHGPIYEAELRRVRRAANPNPGLRDCFAAYYEYRRRPGAEGHAESRRCFESVTARRPELPNAWAGLALLDLDTFGSYSGGTLPHGQDLLRRARAAIDTAKALETHNALAALAEARLLYFQDKKGFLASTERAVALDPENSDTLAVIGTLLTLTGHAERGLPLVDRATALTANPPGYYEIARAAAYLRDGEPEKALEAALDIGAPNWYAMPLFVTAAAALAGRDDIAARGVQKLREIDPALEHTLLERFHLWRFDPALRDALIRGLTVAGALPDSFVPPEGG